MRPEDIKIGVWYKANVRSSHNDLPRICHEKVNSKGEHCVSFKGVFSFGPIFMSLEKFAESVERELLPTD